MRTAPLVALALLVSVSPLAADPGADLHASRAGAEGAIAQAAPILVSTEWVAERLDDRGIVLLHVGSQDSFAAGHLPGARLFPLQVFAPEVDGISTEMPESAALREALEAAGVSSDSHIVIYSVSHPPQLAARLYITLEHFGLAGRSSLLDGGLRAWQAEGRPLSTEAVAVTRGTLPELRPASDLVVDHSYVNARVEDGAAVVLDARDPQFWTGEQQNAQRAARAGRVPGAENIPFRALVDDSGRLLGEDALRALFSDAGVAPGETVVTYCHVGQQASLLFLAARLLGHEVRLYDGSYEDWSSRLELPVSTGP